ncbi:MAG: tRNA (guanosine(46)-N7)-methyltransferase TrmB [Lachnospiraceae bacterium]|nr:tRNA (guanosine(46)-N7)-methyltransferase TrmB [Lachnospiraceae bacterium]
MRLRHIRGAEEKIAQSPYVIQDPEGERGHWNQRFGNAHPIEIEVGMGKGRFIMELAKRYPDRNFIGIERYSSVLLRGLEKREQLELSNIWFLCVDAKDLAEIFEAGEISKIYLNFSDPWPKDRHAKRRLTSPEFMGIYRQILIEGGIVEFKTDNRELFQYSLESIPVSGWEIASQTYDLHHSPLAEGNVMTEYEAKFAAEGKPICKLVAQKPKGMQAE